MLNKFIFGPWISRRKDSDDWGADWGTTSSNNDADDKLDWSKAQARTKKSSTSAAKKSSQSQSGAAKGDDNNLLIDFGSGSGAGGAAGGATKKPAKSEDSWASWENDAWDSLNKWTPSPHFE